MLVSPALIQMAIFPYFSLLTKQHFLIIFHIVLYILEFDVIISSFPMNFLFYFNRAWLFKMALPYLVEEWALYCLFGGEAEVGIELKQPLEKSEGLLWCRRKHFLELVLMPVLTHKVQIILGLLRREKRSIHF